MQDLHTQLLRAGVSSYNVHTNYLGILLECSFCFSKSGVEPNILHFNKVPGDGMMMDLVWDSLVVPCWWFVVVMVTPPAGKEAAGSGIWHICLAEKPRGPSYYLWNDDWMPLSQNPAKAELYGSATEPRASYTFGSMTVKAAGLGSRGLSSQLREHWEHEHIC